MRDTKKPTKREARLQRRKGLVPDPVSKQEKRGPTLQKEEEGLALRASHEKRGKQSPALRASHEKRGKKKPRPQSPTKKKRGPNPREPPK
jgi:hypothetical protein